MAKYGKTWWGSKWMNALSDIDYSNRLPRGRNYANKGAVKDPSISGRKIIAAVQGTRIKPYKVTVEIPAFTLEEKEAFTRAILNNPTAYPHSRWQLYSTLDPCCNGSEGQ